MAILFENVSGHASNDDSIYGSISYFDTMGKAGGTAPNILLYNNQM